MPSNQFSITPGAGEQKRKQEDVQCPVCRAPCSYNSPVSASPTMPVSVPVSTPKGVAVGVVESSKGSSPSHAVLSEDKKILFEKLKAVSFSVVLYNFDVITLPVLVKSRCSLYIVHICIKH